MASTNTDRKNRAMLGDLPQDFLRIAPSSEQQQMAADAQVARTLQHGGGGVTFASSTMAKLIITVAQAKLSKNYGLVKMDPYCRIRLGHSVFETHTAQNGGKNPRWNKTIQCYLPKGIDTVYVEIFDERAFSMDDRVAWAHIQIPDRVFQDGEALDEWYVLNGKQGDGKEGMVNLVMQYNPQAAAPATMQQPIVYTTGTTPIMVVPAGMPAYYPPTVGGAPVSVQQYPAQPVAHHHQPPPQQQQQQQQPQQQQPQQQQPPAGPLYTPQDVQQVKDMFPDTDEEVIRSLLEVNVGSKDATINNLLAMQEG